MNKLVFSAGTVSAIVLGGIVTNPSKQEYSQWVVNQESQHTTSSIGKGLVNLLGGPIVNHSTTLQNYGIFTIFYTNVLGQKATILGAFHFFIPISVPSQTDHSATASKSASVPTSTSNSIVQSSNQSVQSGQLVPNLTSQQPDNPYSANNRPIEVPDGTVQIMSNNGTFKLPVIGIKATYGVSGQTVPSTTPIDQLAPVDFNLPSNLSSSMAIYWVNLGEDTRGMEFLAPQNWKPVSAGIGADGSGGVTLDSPDGQKVTFAYQFNGPALWGIGAYFPELRSWVAQTENIPMSQLQSPTGINEVHIDKNTVAYSHKSPKEQFITNGIAVEHQQGNWFFGSGEVVSPNSQLSQTILNFFLQQTMNDVQ